MNKPITTAFAAALLVCATACNRAEASDPITGTWKADLSSVEIDEKPSVYVLKDGVYSCETCVPPLKVAADGAFHPVKDRPYYDSMSVKTVDDRTVTITRRKGEKVTSESKMVALPDGNTLEFSFSDSSVPDAAPVTGKGTDTRVAAGPAGSHAISGSWKTQKYDNISDEGLTFSFHVDGDTLHMSSPSGQSYAAKLDGSETPVKGDIAGTTVSVQRLAPNSIRETYRRDGKDISVTTMTVGEAGKMTAVSENKIQGSTMKYMALKQ